MLQNSLELFELHITHMCIILNMCLKTGISFYLEGRIMLTIINLTKKFAREEKVEVVYFVYL